MKKLDKKYKVIVIENSNNKKLKYELEKKYKNINVVLSNKNLGFSKGMNLGIKLSKTQFVFLNPSDVNISNNLLNSLNKIIKKFKDFGMLTPSYRDRSIHSNYFIWNKKNKKDINVKYKDELFKLIQVDFIDGTILLNKKKVKKNLFDEKIFIYFETMDLSKRLNDLNIKLYACPQLKFDHYGGQSHKKNFNFVANISRNWHYNWSKFYYFKKHYNYFYALKKVYPNLSRAIKTYIKYFLSTKEIDIGLRTLSKYEIKGIIASIMLRKSNFRAKF